ncbi:MAG: adenylate kinase [Clostridia bacterium]|nr:adenylate kinase [Clostridia bacterium]
MIILISGASHTGKTVLAQKLLEKYDIPYLSIDHLKMGLIRSGNTELTAEDSQEKLTAYLWPIVLEMIKTAVENHQNLIVEGVYIPFDWKKDFSEQYLPYIRYCCLIMTTRYIENNYSDIIKYADGIEKRLDDSDLDREELIRDNEENLKACQKYDCNYLLIDDEYLVDFDVDMGSRK